MADHTVSRHISVRSCLCVTVEEEILQRDFKTVNQLLGTQVPPLPRRYTAGVFLDGRRRACD